MKLIAKVEDGIARIEFDHSEITNGKLEDIYNYLRRQAACSKVVWVDDPLTLRNGIIIGNYSRLVTTDDMAKYACKKVVELIRECEAI